MTGFKCHSFTNGSSHQFRSGRVSWAQLPAQTHVVYFGGQDVSDTGGLLSESDSTSQEEPSSGAQADEVLHYHKCRGETSIMVSLPHTHSPPGRRDAHVWLGTTSTLSSPSLLRAPLLCWVGEACWHPATPSRTEWVSATSVGKCRLYSQALFFKSVLSMIKLSDDPNMILWGLTVPIYTKHIHAHKILNIKR